MFLVIIYSVCCFFFVCRSFSLFALGAPFFMFSFAAVCVCGFLFAFVFSVFRKLIVHLVSVGSCFGFIYSRALHSLIPLSQSFILSVLLCILYLKSQTLSQRSELVCIGPLNDPRYMIIMTLSHTQLENFLVCQSIFTSAVFGMKCKFFFLNCRSAVVRSSSGLFSLISRHSPDRILVSIRLSLYNFSIIFSRLTLNKYTTSRATLEHLR